MDYDRDKAVGWVAEEWTSPGFEDEDDEPYMALGLFTAHVEALDVPNGFIRGPYRVPVEEAVAWARALAPEVVVRVFAPEGQPTHFSAGERTTAGRRSWPRWPEAGLGLKRRRAPAYEYLDRTEADDPISWDAVIAVLRGSGGPVPEFAQHFCGALQRDPAIREVVDWTPGSLDPFPWETDVLKPGQQRLYGFAPAAYPAVRALVRLSAPTVGQGEQLARERAWQVCRRILDSHRIDPAVGPVPWSVDVFAYPTGSKLARLNAKLR